MRKLLRIAGIAGLLVIVGSMFFLPIRKESPIEEMHHALFDHVRAVPYSDTQKDAIAWSESTARASYEEASRQEYRVWMIHVLCGGALASVCIFASFRIPRK